MALPDSANERKELPTNPSNSNLSTYSCSYKTSLRSLDDVEKHKINWKDYGHSKHCPHPGCGAQFSRAFNAQRHWESKHLPDSLRTRWSCAKCQQHYVKRKDLKNHSARKECTFNRTRVPLVEQLSHFNRRTSLSDDAAHMNRGGVFSVASDSLSETHEPTRHNEDASDYGLDLRTESTGTFAIDNAVREGRQSQQDVRPYVASISQNSFDDISVCLERELFEALNDEQWASGPLMLFGDPPSTGTSITEDSRRHCYMQVRIIPRRDAAAEEALSRRYFNLHRLWANLKSAHFGPRRQKEFTNDPHSTAVSQPEGRRTMPKKLGRGLERLRRLLKI